MPASLQPNASRLAQPVMRFQVSSLHLDVRLANDAAELLVLLVKKNGEIHAAQPDRKKPLDGKLRLDLGCLHCCGEPARQLGNRFLWRFRRSQHPGPEVHL